MFYAQNWYLASQATDYLNADTPPTAFQHFWSLAIEEQFYFAWPLVLLAAVAGTRMLRRRLGVPAMTTHTTAICALAAVAIVVSASFVSCLWLASHGGPQVYFGTHVRAWQLGAGGLLAFIPPTFMLSIRKARLLALIGLAGLTTGFWWINGSTQYPDLSATVPVLSTAALIIASTHGTPHLNLLRSRVAVAIGDRSYALYLVHWPIIVLVTATTMWTSPIRTLIIILATLAAAAALFRWIEQPARQHPRLQKPGFVFLATILSMATVASLLIGLTTRTTARPDPAVTASFSTGYDSNYGAPALSTRTTFLTGSEIFPDPETATKTDWAMVDKPECQAEEDDPKPALCTFGPSNAKTTIALVGDSHATQWFPALQDIAEKRNWRIKTYLHSSCAFSHTPRAYNSAQEVACQAGNKNRLKLISSDADIDVVVTSALAGDGFAGEDTNKNAGADGFAKLWVELENSGIDVVVLRDNPQYQEKTKLLTCVQQHRKNPDACALDLRRSLPHDRQLTAAAQTPSVDLLDLTSLFCRGARCPVVIGNVLVYRDNHHISATYAKSLAPSLEAELTQLCTRVTALCAT